MRASQVAPEAVEWAWEPYVPQGKLTLLAGDPGQGKSLFVTWLAAAISTGRLGDEPKPVLVYSAEDDPADTIVPRLIAAKANLDLIELADGEFTEEELAAKQEELGTIGLVTVDPISAYLGKANAWKSAEVRRRLEPLRKYAAATGTPIVLVQHLNRRADAMSPLARIADSQGIPQLCRSVLLWGPDPVDPEGDDGSSKVLTRAKGNLSKAPSSATFAISQRDIGQRLAAPALVRGEDRDIDALDVLADEESRSATEEAVEWLRDQLANGPIAAKEMVARIRESGLSERTVNRAKRRAGVISEPSRNGDTRFSEWVWRLK